MSEESMELPPADEHDAGGEEAIAIVGMAGRFPGARDLHEFWQNLCEGKEGISFLSTQELADAGVSAAELRHPDYVRATPLLEDIADFDGEFFGFSRPEAELTDPQHRLFMECAWQALEDAGCDPQRAPGQIGVFAGASLSTYLFFNLRDTFTLSEGGFQSLIGNDKDYVASHTAYKLDLGGPSVGVQSACSTSLVAVHLACQSLLSGEVDAALAGGVTVKPHKTGYMHQEGGLFSPDGHCRPFDADARGTIFGSGVGAVMLKRLDDAQAAGDRIYAVILGSAVNNDGSRKVGYTAPGEDGQVRVVSEALSVADVDPESIAYVETHGTGTSLGDPIEIAALKKVFRDVPDGDRCALGAVKSNVGHLESAAGIVGLIKTVLALHHGELVPSLHFEAPNPQIDFDRSPFFVNTRRRPWPDLGAPRRAGVSSFGIGGTNAHVVLEEAPAAAQSRGAQAVTEAAQILPMSARGPEALRQLAAAYQERLRSAGDSEERIDLAANAALRRSHHDHRLALVLTPEDEDPAALLDTVVDDDGANKTLPAGLARGRRHPERRPKVVFVFPGQGSQWQGMGQQLMATEPVFRQAIDECAGAIQRHSGWSLHEVLAASPEDSRLGELDVVQPTLFAIQVALARLWQSWGVEPAAVIGHSLGEVAASCIAGALSLDDAAKVICRRSHLALEARGQGGMMLVELPYDDAQAALAGHEDRVAIAAYNSPRATVLSGEDASLDILEKQLGERQIFCRRIQVDFASHSPQVDPLLPRLGEILADLTPRAGQVPMYSTVGSARLTDGAGFDAQYWRDNLRQPVMLADAVRQARQDGHHIFVEISPHPILVPSLTDCLGEALTPTEATSPGESEVEGRVLPSLRRQQDERTMLLETLAALYADGCPIDFSAVTPADRPFVELPTYPWQRQPYWIEDDSAGDGSAEVTGGDRQNLIGAPIRSILDPQTRIWQLEVSTRRFPYLAEHKVQDAVVTSAAFYLELVFAAAHQALGTDRPILENVRLHQAMFLPSGHRELVQMVLTPEGPTHLAFRIASRSFEDAAAEDATWTLRANGRVLRPTSISADGDSAETEKLDREAIEQRLGEAIGREAFFEERREQGFDYGPAYQGLESIQRVTGEALAQLRLPAVLAPDAERYRIHPALLDVTLQVVAAAAPAPTDDAIYLEVGFDRVRLHGSPRGELWAHGVLAPDEDTENTGVKLYDHEGQLLLEVDGFLTRRIEDVTGPDESLDDQLFEVRWHRQPLTVEPATGSRRWLLLADRGDVARHLEAELSARGDRCLKAMVGERFERLADGTFTLSPTRSEDAERLWQEALAQGPLDGVIYLWGLDAEVDDDAGDHAFEAATHLTSDGPLHLLQTADSGVTPRWILVSRGVHPLPEDLTNDISSLTPAIPSAITQAPLWGLGAVVANEHPELQCLNVDLSAGDVDPREIDLLLSALDSEGEQRLAVRGEHCYHARLQRLTAEEEESSTSADASNEDSDSEAEGLSPAGDRPYRLSLTRSGDLDSLTLQAQASTPELAPDEVLIEVQAAGLGFRDVLSAMGLYPDSESGATQLGSECAGVVIACGSEVESLNAALKPGASVIALSLESFGRHARTKASFAVAKPDNLSFEQAGGLAVPYLAALYGLVKLARLQPGEKVLIHSAATGAGLAALQLAQYLGAEVLATAGSPEKRAFLRSAGVELVMDSRSLDFAGQVMAATDEGVDVVFNSLTGEAMAASLDLLAPYGRFVELGLSDIAQNRQVGLRAFRNNVSYFAINQARMMRDRPQAIARLLRRVVELFADGYLQPFEVTAFPFSRATQAFEHMAQARHLGRIVLTPDPEPDQVPIAPASADGPATPDDEGSSLPVRGDGTYLITGGLGGLGLTFARWLAAQGAGGLILLGRRGATEETATQIEELRSAGTEVRAVAVDVADGPALQQALAGLDGLPPLRGVLHAAGVLADATLENQNAESFRQVLRPKVNGAWNLHRLTENDPLDFFVLFSSTVTLFANLGQSNYAAANFALDVLARQRRAAGLPGLSVNWGAFSGVGLWAANDPEEIRQQEERLAFGGMSSLRPNDGPRALARLWSPELHQNGSAAQVAVMPFSMADWQLADPHGSGAPLFAQLAAEVRHEDDEATGELRGELLEASEEERQHLLEAFLVEQVSSALRTQVDVEALDAPLSSLGLDSLMALGLRNRIEHQLGIPIPIVQFLQSPSLRQFATELLQRLVLEQVMSTEETTDLETDTDDEDWEVVTI